MIEKVPFGSTGHASSRVVFGGAALSEASGEGSRRALELLLRHGVNHVDTSASYGESERWIGTWMEDHRDDFFLATKIDSREAGESRRELERSLAKLKTERLDLLQMHEIVRREDLPEIFGPRGAFRTLREAKESGTARFVGVTGHGFEAPALLAECLERYPFDSVLLPFNHALGRHEEYGPAFASLAATCRERGVAVQTMKAIARGEWGSHRRDHATWYRPLDSRPDIDRAVHWVLGHPGLFLCSPGDLDLLPLVLDAADRFEHAPEEAEMEEMRGRLDVHAPPQPEWPRVAGA